MKYLLIVLVSIILLGFIGYQIGSSLILPICYGDDLLNQSANEECFKTVNEIHMNNKISGLIYGSIAGLILGLIITFIGKKIKSKK